MKCCKRCGAQIADLDKHPMALFCQDCRYEHRTTAYLSSIKKYKPVLEEVLRSEGWPVYVRPSNVARECPQPFIDAGVKPEGIGVVVGNALSHVVCDDGSMYKRYNAKTYKKEEVTA